MIPLSLLPALAALAGTPAPAPPLPALLVAGTELAIRFPSALAGGSDPIGETVVVQLMAPVSVDGCAVLPAFSRVAGRVALSRGAGLLRRGGVLALRFDSLETAPGAWTPIDARLDSLEYAPRHELRAGVLRPDGRSVEHALMPVALAGGVDLDLVPLAFIGAWELLARGPGAVILAGEIGRIRLEGTIPLPRPLECRRPEASPEAALPALPPFHPFTANRDGTGRGDPINLVLTGTGAALDSAFARAGWTAAERPTPARLVRAVTAILAALPTVDDAPVSTQYFEGRPQERAYEIAGPNARIRHHLRLWRLEPRRDVWVAAANKDIGIRFSPWKGHATHRIDGRIDRERGYVTATLEAAGCADLLDYVALPGARTHTRNTAGQSISTDGRAAVLAVHSCHRAP